MHTVGQALSKLSLQSSLESQSKIGLAVIVSNDYANNEPRLAKLHGAHKDANRMFTVFTKLGYKVFLHTNVTSSELTNVVSELTNDVSVATTLQYSPSYKHLVFVFSGYASSDGMIHSQEGNTVDVTKIVSSCKYPKLVFLNLCVHPLMFTVVPDYEPRGDNILVAWSTLPYEELQSGSLWIEILASKILTQNKDVTTLLNDVNNRLKELYSSLPSFEGPQFVSRLTEPVNFLAELPSDFG